MRSAATAANSAFAGDVRPDTRRAGTPSRRRLAAVLSSERNVNELEVYDDTAREIPIAGTFHFSADSELASDAIDNRRRRIALLDRNELDAATPCLDRVTANDLISRPVCPFHQKIGLHKAHDLGGCVL